jgi:hypothetical protein
MKKNDVGFVMWGLYDKDEASAMLKHGARTDGHWPVSQLTEMGYYSRRLVGGRQDWAGIIPVIGIIFVAGSVFVWIRKGRG